WPRLVRTTYSRPRPVASSGIAFRPHNLAGSSAPRGAGGSSQTLRRGPGRTTGASSFLPLGVEVHGVEPSALLEQLPSLAVVLLAHGVRLAVALALHGGVAHTPHRTSRLRRIGSLDLVCLAAGHDQNSSQLR